MAHAVIYQYVIAPVSSIGGSLALLDEVRESYATCHWKLTVSTLDGLLLLRPMLIVSVSRRLSFYASQTTTNSSVHVACCQ